MSNSRSSTPVRIEGPFITTLHQVLSDDSWQRVVAWSETSTSFIVIDVEAFRNYILIPHFNDLQFADFVRILGTYNFHVSVNTLTFRDSSFTSEGWEFCHPGFRPAIVSTPSVIGQVILRLDSEQSVAFSAEGAHLLAIARDKISDLRQKVARLQGLTSPKSNEHSAPVSAGSSPADLPSNLDSVIEDDRILIFNDEQQSQTADHPVQLSASPPPISPIGALPLSLDGIDSERLRVGYQQRDSPRLNVLPPDSPEPSRTTFSSSLSTLSPSASYLKATPDYAPSSSHPSSVAPKPRSSPSSLTGSSAGSPRGRALFRTGLMLPSSFGKESVPSQQRSSSSPSRSRFTSHLSSLGAASGVVGSDGKYDSSMERFDESVIISPDMVDPEDVRTHIRGVVSKTLEGLPTRLINTDDGQLYTRASLHAAFDSSEQYHHLTSLIRTKNLLHDDFIKEVVQTYFRYAMLSHRWEHYGEPSLSDVTTSIFAEDTDYRFFKLRMYCRTARERGMKWAWCDTCCINKESSSELEEAVTSMFRWYRNSALTIVYLSDVSGLSHETLTKSQWFTRGWTLQELLAPRVMQFYDRTWIPCVKGGHYNHKDVPDWMQSLERVTGIPVKVLQDYVPGTDNPREKLRWASSRTTTRVEDIGYCLVGIFDVALTPHYGEEEKAFERLLLKVMKAKHDISLLDWVGKGSKRSSFIPTHPNGFRYPSFADIQPQSSASASQSNGSSPSSSFVTPTGIIGGLFSSPLKTIKHSPVPYSITEPSIEIFCFVHKVDVKNGYSRVTLTEVGWGKEQEGLISYSIYGAEDLAEFTVVMKEALEALPAYRLPFVVARLWDPVLYEPSSDSNKMKPSKKFRDLLMKPFVALLLVEGSESGVYRRIPTEDRVVARLAKAPKSDYQAISLRVA